MAVLVELGLKGAPVGACLRGTVFGLVDVAGEVFGDDGEVYAARRWEVGENAVRGCQACDPGAEDDDVEFGLHVVWSESTVWMFKVTNCLRGGQSSYRD